MDEVAIFSLALAGRWKGSNWYGVVIRRLLLVIGDGAIHRLTNFLQFGLCENGSWSTTFETDSSFPTI